MHDQSSDCAKGQVQQAKVGYQSTALRGFQRFHWFREEVSAADRKVGGQGARVIGGEKATDNQCYKAKQ